MGSPISVPIKNTGLYDHVQYLKNIILYYES